MKKSGGGGGGENLYKTSIYGLDIYDPAERKSQDKDGNDIPCWMLDIDYDGQCFRARQVFFPRTKAWENIKKTIKTEFADTVWERLKSNTSEPFALGDNRQIAVKVIDDRGNELMVVKKAEEAKDAEDSDS